MLSCADSRVPVELVFDQSIGHVFVVRVAGNVATPDTIASLEYGAAVLGVKAILALGHTNCGAVKATMAGKAVPGQISTLYQYIHPAIAGANGDLTTASRQNASLQASVLRETSPVLAIWSNRRNWPFVLQCTMWATEKSPCSEPELSAPGATR